MNISTSLADTLNTRIADRSARIVTVGLGYVGLPLALTIHEQGFDVTGFDTNDERTTRIADGERVISYFSEQRIANAVATKRFGATSDPAVLGTADIVLICVPTPLGPDRAPDLGYVERASRTIADWLRPGQMIVLESTVWPGATRTVVQPILEATGLRIGRDFFLGFSPEREDPGNASHTTRSIPKVVGADDAQSRLLLTQFYDQVVDRTVPVASTATAEAVKLVENSFRNVNIALVNELKQALGAMNVDVWDVIDAAATKPFGFMPFYPGPGIGGDCIPVSPVYLSWRANDVGSSTPIIDLARHTNEHEPGRLADQIVTTLKSSGHEIAATRILILGITYKKDVEDTRESPALALFGGLERQGASVSYHDPFFPVLPLTRDHPHLAGRASIDLTGDTLASFDAVVIATDHTCVDYSALADCPAVIFDTRNVMAKTGFGETTPRLRKI